MRLQCDTAEDAQLLRKAVIKWGDAFEGLTIHTPKHGIVIHGVPKEEVNPAERQDNLIAQIENDNPALNEKIVQIAPLRRSTQEDESKADQSLVVFVNEVDAMER